MKSRTCGNKRLLMWQSYELSNSKKSVEQLSRQKNVKAILLRTDTFLKSFTKDQQQGSALWDEIFPWKTDKRAKESNGLERRRNLAAKRGRTRQIAKWKPPSIPSGRRKFFVGYWLQRKIIQNSNVNFSWKPLPSIFECFIAKTFE